MPQAPAPPPRPAGRPPYGVGYPVPGAQQPGYRPPPGRSYGAPPPGGGSPGAGGPGDSRPPRRRRSGLSIGLRIAAGLLSLAILVSSGVAWSFYKNFVSDVQTITLAAPVDQNGNPVKDIDG